MQRLGLDTSKAAPTKPTEPIPLPPSVLDPSSNISPDNPKPFTARLLNFLEHGWVLTPLGIFGGILGIVYAPFLFITVLCVLGAVHRTKLVSIFDVWIQVAAYLLIGSIAYGGCYFTIYEAKKTANLTTNELINGITTNVTNGVAAIFGSSKKEGTPTQKAASTPPQFPQARSRVETWPSLTLTQRMELLSPMTLVSPSSFCLEKQSSRL
jgi:hypothetical protein